MRRLPAVLDPLNPSLPTDQPTKSSTYSEYYFTEQNLRKDVYLRGKMNADGWISAAEIAHFNRIRALLPRIPEASDDMAVLMAALEGSSVVEAACGRLRPRKAPRQWVLVQGPAGEQGQ